MKKSTITPCLNLQFLCIIPQRVLVRFWLNIGEKSLQKPTDWVGCKYLTMKVSFFIAYYFFERSKALCQVYITYVIFWKSTCGQFHPVKLQNARMWPPKWKCVSFLCNICGIWLKNLEFYFWKHCTMIYAFILMLFFKNYHPEKQNPYFNVALVQNILENFFSQNYISSDLQTWLKNIHHITF